MRLRNNKKQSLLIAFVCCAILAMVICVSVGIRPASEDKLGNTAAVQDSAQMEAHEATDKRSASSAGSEKGDAGDKDLDSGAASRSDQVDGDGLVGGEGQVSGDDRSDANGPASGGAEDGGLDVEKDGGQSQRDHAAASGDVPSADVPMTSGTSAAADSVISAKASDNPAPRDVVVSSDSVIELVDEPVFTIPAGVAYVPGEVLVTVDKGLNAAQLAELLRASDARTVDPDSAQWVTDDMVRFDVAEGFSVEDAVNELLVVGVAKNAQPDYVYFAEETAPSNGALYAMQDADALGNGTGASDAATTTGEMAADGDVVVEDASATDDADAIVVQSDDGGYLFEADEDTEGVRDAQDAMDSLAALDVQGADGNAVAQNDPISDDPYSVFQWNLPSINAQRVWDLEQESPLTKVGVAIIDCGFDVNHPDIKNMVAPGSPYNAYRASRGETDAALLADVSSGSDSEGVGKFDHGMHIAGIVAAQRNNGVGIAGITDNAQLVPIRAFNYSSTNFGATSGALAKAFDYVIQNKATYNIRVVNLSLGMKVSSIATDDKLCEQIDRAYAEGIITVCSAGNEGRNGPYINYPSDWATAVSVINLRNETYATIPKTYSASTGYTGATWSSAMDVTRNVTSNYNAPDQTTKDISAPGVNILSTTDNTTTNILGNEEYYMFDSGTSMAAPHATGVLAIMFGKTEVDANGEGSQYMVDKLYESARTVKDDVAFDPEYGHGEVDALGAWNALDDPFVEGPTYVVAGQSGVTYAVVSDKTSTSAVASGWSFASSDKGVLEVDESTGACTPKAMGAVQVTATKGARSLTKTVTVFGGIQGLDVTMAGATTDYGVDEPTAMAWEWGVEGDAFVTESGVLTAGKSATKLTLSATLVATKGSPYGVTLTKDVYVLGALTGASVQAGEDVTLSLEAPEGFDESDSEFVWWSSDATVATVKGGVVRGVRGGTATIWVAPRSAITVDDGGVIRADKGMSCSAAVNVKDSIARSEVKVLGLGNKTYTGSAIMPEPLLTYGSTILTPKVDYTVAYSNNVKAGNATVTIAGKGCFAGTTRTAAFKIVPAKVSSAKAEAIAVQAYTGKVVTPKPKLTFGGKALKLGTDYTLAYKGNVKAGTATVVVTGRGNFKGTKSVPFKIVAPTVSYRAYVQDDGWKAWATGGKTSGTTGKSKRAEAVGIKVSTLPVSGGITYRAYVQGSGWQAWTSNGATAGLANKGRRLEALQVKLTGKMAKRYDVLYRVHCQRVGWTKWVKSGTVAGAAKSGLRIEALQVRLVPRG